MGLITSIDNYLPEDSSGRCIKGVMDSDLSNLLISTLEEFQLKLRQMALIQNKKYSLKLKPTWAFALRAAFAGCVDITTLEGITMMRICDDVHREYALLINN